jgi:hypothetical protein
MDAAHSLLELPHSERAEIIHNRMELQMIIINNKMEKELTLIHLSIHPLIHPSIHPSATIQITNWGSCKLK